MRTVCTIAELHDYLSKYDDATLVVFGGIPLMFGADDQPQNGYIVLDEHIGTMIAEGVTQPGEYDV